MKKQAPRLLLLVSAPNDISKGKIQYNHFFKSIALD